MENSREDNDVTRRDVGDDCEVSQRSQHDRLGCRKDEGAESMKLDASRGYTSVEVYDPVKQMVKSRLRELEPLRELMRLDNEPRTERPAPLLSRSDIPEAIFVGEILEAFNFDLHSCIGICFKFVWEAPFFHVEGDVTGQTQTVIVDATTKCAPLNHPIGVHFAATSTVGWPKLLVDVRGVDEYGRSLSAGYGYCHLPMLPGVSDCDIDCWRPTGSMHDEVANFFLGHSANLTANDTICSMPAFTNRCRLITVPAGKIRLRFSTFLRYFGNYSIDSPSFKVSLKSPTS